MSGLKYLSNEKGIVLVVSLMLLVTLTVMGLAAISTTSTEIKISGNERLNAQAFQTAEAGVREMLHRMAVAPGTMVTVNGGTFDTAIVDPGWSPVNCTNPPCPLIKVFPLILIGTSTITAPLTSGLIENPVNSIRTVFRALPL